MCKNVVAPDPFRTSACMPVRLMLFFLFVFVLAFGASTAQSVDENVD
jgi:hypothetical protein